MISRPIMDAHDEKHPEGDLPSWRTVTAGDELEREGGGFRALLVLLLSAGATGPMPTLCGALILFGFS